MSLIPDELIEQIRDAADLVGLIGEAVSLKRAGSDWRGPCPFHGGTHRNFAVIPKKGMYYCYVCHEAGDVFTYLMKKQGLDYPTAVREVARKVGIVVPERGTREGPDPREPLFSAMAVAQEWFARSLRENSEADPARKYLESRDLPLEVAASEGLGYAPRGNEFRAAMKQLGIDERVLLEAGLLMRREDGTVSSRFRGRLLFPIKELRSRVVAFGGRILGPGEPKYLNSPETPIFHKGSMLYHLHDAKHAIRREGEVLLVEGYFDVLRLVLAGIEHVVAPLGTSLTGEQAALLKRYAPTVILLYDSDGPGLRATFRAADEALRHGLRAKVATMPEGEDPDTLVRRGGAAALATILKDAIDVLDRKIQLLERSGWFDTLEHRREALDKLLDTARAASDPIARDLYLSRIAERTGVTRAVLDREEAARPPAPERRPDPRPAVAAPRATTPEPGRHPGAKLERRLLKTLLASAEWLERARSEIPPGTFEIATHREIFESLLALPPKTAPSAALDRLSSEAQDALQRMLAAVGEEAGSEISHDEEYVGALNGLRARGVSRSLPPVSDVGERQQQLSQLSQEDRTRILLQNKADKARRRPGRSGPDYTPSP